jgi:hypothetical protein
LGSRSLPIESDLLSPDFDWRVVSELARDHRIAPLLWRSFRDWSLPAPAETARRTLESVYLANAARNALLFQVLGDALRALGALRKPVIVLKGALLAETVYPERALRPMNDIDLLVREEELENAETHLLRGGFERAADPRTPDELRQQHHHWVFRHTAPIFGGIPVELHWRLHPPGYPFRAILGDLWGRAVPTRVAGFDVLGLAPEDLLLHLCTHLCRHRFRTGLIGLCDIAAVISRHGDRIAWPRLQTRAAEWEAASHASVPLELARELLEAAVPETTLAVLRETRDDPLVLGLARERILEEKGILREAAKARVRWRQKAFKEKRAAFRRLLRPRGANDLVRRYGPAIETLLRHPRKLSAIAADEARKARLDLWCSPRTNGEGDATF